MAVQSAAVAVQALLPGTAPIGLLLAGPVLIGLYSVAAYAGRTGSWIGLALVAAATGVHDLADPVWRADLESASWWWLVLLLGLLAGRWVGSRRAAADLERRHPPLEKERRGAGEGAVAEERARIARELHDVVAHNVSVMVVQAGRRRRSPGADPDRARERAGDHRATGRDALAEMRRLLGVLRAADAEPSTGAAAGSRPTLDRLVAGPRAPASPVELHVDGARAAAAAPASTSRRTASSRRR